MSKKYLFISVLVIISGLFSRNGYAQDGTYNSMYSNRQARTEWFRDARFGMFIHWGVYSIPARGEWVRSAEEMSIEDYQKYVDTFNPVDYSPREWARLAKEAGMKYALITAKHHDGFCLFDSKLTDYKSTNTPAKRDLLKEFVDAFREEGLKIGFYYSVIDWHHQDYPAYGDRQHPMRNIEEWKNQKYDWNRYIDYMHGQVRELCSNYGKIDIMWFDFSYNEFSGEKWKATELVKLVRTLQPGIILDNRLGGNMEIENPQSYAGDFEGPEQYIPVRPVLDIFNKPVPWEVCMTLNNNWGYSASDKEFKTSTDVVRSLVNCVSKGGNLLLNVGPDATGKIPEESVKILKDVGKWMSKNSESIYGAGVSDFPKPDWGRYTQNGNILYAHVFDQNIGQICAEGLMDKVKSARLLIDGSEIFLSGFWNGDHKPYVKPSDLFLSLGKPTHNTFRLPDKDDTVIKIVLK